MNRLDLDRLPPGRRIRVLRHALGLTQREAGALVGTFGERVYDLEKGRSRDIRLEARVTLALLEQLDQQSHDPVPVEAGALQ